MHKAPSHAVERFRQNRFGMFIHFGLYSILNRREWALFYERIPLEEYHPLIQRFNPAPDAIEDWVRLAKQCGMRYMCMTTRHHDGFCLFDTKASEFNVMNSPARRDLVREFVEACRAHGIRPALYYSVGNWSDPGFTGGPQDDPDAWRRFVETAQVQLRELMSNYGPIDYLFYDGCPPAETWNGEALNAELRRLQPDLLISDRCGLDEDVASSENHLKPHAKPWECCMTTNGSWGCNSGDIHRKSVYELIRSLACCIHNGGNFLLNLGPLADGSIPLEDRLLFESVGAWVQRNQEAVYDTLPNPFKFHDKKLSCYRGNTTYTALHWYYGPDTVIAGVGNTVQRARLLATGREISFRQTNNRVLLTGLPDAWPDILPVVALDLDGPPRGVRNPYESGITKYEF